MEPAKNFKIKDAVLLCFFLMGVRFITELMFYVVKINAALVYDIAFLVIVIFIIKNFGRQELYKILAFRPISVYVFSSLVILFLGFEILNAELVNILAIIIPRPDILFGQINTEHFIMTIISMAIFPAVTEELFFRGVILRRLRHNYPEKKAIFFSALFFGLMHLNPWQALHAFFSGLLLGRIYLKFRTIWVCMFFHCYNNILASFMIVPVKILSGRTDYSTQVMFPLWFDILGLLLFGTGLGLTALLSSKAAE
jgi:membrane protease YdiL (CAAX protease family)